MWFLAASMRLDSALQDKGSNEAKSWGNFKDGISRAW